VRWSTIDDEFVGAMGDRDGTTDPQFVKVWRGVFEWKNATLPQEYDNTSMIGTYFTDANNRGSFFDSSGATRAANITQVPKLALIPAEVALRVLETPTTPWELYELLLCFSEEKGTKVLNLIQTPCTWAVMVSIKGQNAETSAVAYALPLLSHHTEHLKTFLKPCLATTVGEILRAPPAQNQSPAYIVQQAVALIPNQMPTMDMMNDLYMQGCNSTMRLYHDMHLETIYKRFSDVQKAAVCG